MYPLPIANPWAEPPRRDQHLGNEVALFLFTFDTWRPGRPRRLIRVAAWARRLDDARDAVAEWLDEHEPGAMLGEWEVPGLVEHARDELGPGASDTEVAAHALRGCTVTEFGTIGARELGVERVTRLGAWHAARQPA